MYTSQFKSKVKKRGKQDSRRTLDSIHSEYTQRFDHRENEVELAHDKLRTLQQELDEATDSIHMGRLQKEIYSIEERIRVLEHNDEMIQYYLENGEDLFTYYDTKEGNIRQPSVHPSSTSSRARNQRPTVIDFFQDDDGDQYKDSDSCVKYHYECDYSSNDANDSCEDSLTDTMRFPWSTPGKGEIMERYMNYVNKDYVMAYKYDMDSTHCTCGGEWIQSEGRAMQVCSKCADIRQVLTDFEKPSYKEPPREVTYYTYKRLNHFVEWLSQFQAKESTEISDDIFDMIVYELKKERIVNVANIKNTKMREILQRLKLNKYYEHIPHIINKLNGVPAPMISRDVEEKLRSMFKVIQLPFMRHCPPDRKNFLSYSYVLHKFCQLLELDELLPNFPLLKSREKLYIQDSIWKKICSDLNWEFYPSL